MSDGWGGIGLVAEAATRLLAARAALRFLPFRKVARTLGEFTASADAHGCKTPGRPADAETARAVAWAVGAAARRVPFEVACLAQAMAAQGMLRRRGIAASIYLGASRDGAGVMEAHAWLDAAGIGVTGHPVPPKLRPFGCFVTRL